MEDKEKEIFKKSKQQALIGIAIAIPLGVIFSLATHYSNPIESLPEIVAVIVFGILALPLHALLIKLSSSYRVKIVKFHKFYYPLDWKRKAIFSARQFVLLIIGGVLTLFPPSICLITLLRAIIGHKGFFEVLPIIFSEVSISKMSIFHYVHINDPYMQLLFLIVLALVGIPCLFSAQIFGPKNVVKNETSKTSL
jgi:hypothetical protein